MPHNKSDVAAIIKQLSQPDIIQQSIVCWYNKPFEKGATVQAGPEQLKVPFPSTLVFVDAKPKANWSHPCQYIFLSQDGDETAIHEAQYPPFMADPPAEYTVILRYGEPPQDERNFSPY